jgi:hypothetical protein
MVTAPTKHMDEGGFRLPEDFYGEQIATLENAAVVINTASTLTVDASLLDRPVVSIAYDLFPDQDFPEGRSSAFNSSTHFAPLIELGGVVKAKSPEHLLRVIERYIEDPSIDSEGRSRIVHHVLGSASGDSGVRLAAEVLRLSLGGA